MQTLTFTASVTAWTALTINTINNEVFAAGDAAVTGGGQEVVVGQFTESGHLNTSFGNDGTVALSVGNTCGAVGIYAAADGEVIVAGTGEDSSGNSEFFLADFQSGDESGDLITTFGTDGVYTTEFSGAQIYAAAMTLTPAGDLLVVGQAEYSGGGTAFLVVEYDLG